MRSRSIFGHRVSAGRRGFLVVLVMVMLCFFGILAGSQVIIQASSGLSARALDLRRQRLGLSLRIERALGEALISVLEDQGMGGTLSLSSVVEERLNQLGRGQGRVSLLEAPASLPVQTWLPLPNQEPLERPSDALLSVAAPDLRDLMGERIHESVVSNFRFHCEQDAPSGAVLSWDASYLARIVSVPLSRFPFVAYDLPHEIGEALGRSSMPKTFRLLGLAASRDPSGLGQLSSSPDVQVYHFRRRASEALAYQRLFSQSCVDALAAAAGPTHIVDLAVPESASAVLTGLTRLADGAALDLALVGNGSFGGIAELRDVLVLFSSEPGKTLRISDGGGEITAPLTLLVMGKAPHAMAVELGSTRRPLLLLAVGCRLNILPGSILKAALFLSPDSTLSAESASVAHVSLHAGLSAPGLSGLISGQNLPPELERRCPRVFHAALERARP